MRPAFYNYILTNWNKTVYYTGVTNNLECRLLEHWIGKAGSFTSRYQVYYLVWHENTNYINNAIERENSIKRMSREQKEILIREINPDLKFLNEEIIGNWPPTEEQIDAVKERPK